MEDDTNMDGENMMPTEEPLSLRDADGCPECKNGVLEMEHHGQLECQSCAELFEYRGEEPEKVDPDVPDPDVPDADEDGYMLEARRLFGLFDEAKPRELRESFAEIDRVQDEEIKRVGDLEISINHLKEVITRKVQMTLSPKDKGFVLFCIAMMLLLPWAAARAVYTPSIPATQVSVAAPEVTINGSEIVDSLMTRRLDFDARTGLYMPLPPAADDASVFRETCVDVCRAAARWIQGSTRRGEEPLPEDRVLVNDPRHQICTCFTGSRVTRYVGWVRQ